MVMNIIITTPPEKALGNIHGDNIIIRMMYLLNGTWVHSIFPAPRISRENDQRFQLFLKDYDKWLNVLEEETNEYMKTC